MRIGAALKRTLSSFSFRDENGAENGGGGIDYCNEGNFVGRSG